MAYTWTAGTITSTDSWVAMDYGAGKVVAIVGGFNNIVSVSSDDGVNWTAGTLPVSEYWSDIAYNGTVFCAICNTTSTVAATSSDGVTWVQRTLPANVSWTKIAAGQAGKLCAIARDSTSCAVSNDDGVTWTSGVLPDNRRWNGIAWNGYVWVASAQTDPASSPTNKFAISTDGLAWEFVTVPTGSWLALASNEQGFCAVRNASQCITSPDGRTWTLRTLPSSAFWNAITATIDGNFVIAAQGTTQAAESADDGVSWTASVLPSTSFWADMCHTGKRVVLIAVSVTATAYSNASAIATYNTRINERLAQVESLSSISLFDIVRSDTMAMTTPIVVEAITIIREAVRLADTINTTALLSESIVEALRLDARLAVVLDALVNDSLLLVSVENGVTIKSVALMDAMLLMGAATSQVNAMALLTEALVLNSVINLVTNEVIADNMALVDSLASKLIAMESLIASVVLTDSAQSTAIISVLVNDSLAVNDSTSLRTLQNASINEAIDFSVSFSFDGLPYYAVCMNAKTKAITEFTNYNFNSLATFNKKMYGANEAGVFEMIGDSDNGTPINARLKTFFSRIAEGKHARAESAYLGYKSNGALQLKVIVSDQGIKKAYVYDLVAQPATTLRPGRIKIGRGIKSVYFAFDLSNTLGADFDLDVLEIRPLALSRRIP